MSLMRIQHYLFTSPTSGTDLLSSAHQSVPARSYCGSVDHTNGIMLTLRITQLSGLSLHPLLCFQSSDLHESTFTSSYNYYCSPFQQSPTNEREGLLRGSQPSRRRPSLHTFLTCPQTFVTQAFDSNERNETNFITKMKQLL